MPNARAISSDDASARVKNLKFERYYEVWDSDRKGPSPEEQGTKDAEEEMENFWEQVDDLASIT